MRQLMTVAKVVVLGASLSILASLTSSIAAKQLAAQFDAAQVREFTGTVADSIVLSEYLVSEKYDGVRAHWDGQYLRTRAGHIIHVPIDISNTFPSTSFEAELWLGYGKFEVASALARRDVSDVALWQQAKLLVFDSPADGTNFTGRVKWMEKQLSMQSAYVQVVKQQQLHNWQQVTDKFNQVLNAGGEGLMLHHSRATYRLNNKTDLIKIKPFYDTEARVVGHNMGYGGDPLLLKSLQLALPSGVQFRLATGFSIKQRSKPPAIGARVTFKFYGWTNGGVPRHASFLRVREPANSIHSH